MLLNRGNHEDEVVGRAYGFFDEVRLGFSVVFLHFLEAGFCILSRGASSSSVRARSLGWIPLCTPTNVCEFVATGSSSAPTACSMRSVPAPGWKWDYVYNLFRP